MEDLKPEIEEEMDVFDEADFLDKDIEDTNDNDLEEKEEESDDEAHEDDVELDNDLVDDDAAKDDDITNAPTPKTFKVMINHEEREVSEEDPDFINYLQKGMDYDRVKDQVNTYKNDPRLSFVENQAKKYDMTPDQYINAVYQQQYQSEIDELIDSGVDETVAKEVVDTRRQKESKPQSQEHKELVDFVDYYAKINGKQFDPDTDTLPDEVWKANADGTPLKVAYMENLVQQKQEQQKLLQKQDEQKRQNEEAKKKAPVKGVSMNGTGKSPRKDPLLDGLFED